MASADSASDAVVTGADVRIDRNGYTIVLRSGERRWPVREGGRVRRWARLDPALAYLVAHYGVLPIRLCLKQSAKKSVEDG